MTQSLFRIEMLPALHGDSLFVEYGDPAHPRRLLIDGGPIGAYPVLEARINAMPAGQRRIELLVMTHVDTDHVEGILRLFANKPLPVNVQEVWFNGWKHLEESQGVLGATQGEFLSALLVRRLRPEQWNKSFGNKAVMVSDDGPLPELSFEGGLNLTLLSPTAGTLEKMRQEWKRAVDRSIIPGDLEAAWQKLATRKSYLPGQGLLGGSARLDALVEKQLDVDDTKANGSSIAFLAEVADKSCLFLADAHHEVIISSLKRLLKQRGQSTLKVDAVKVSHHGSVRNVSDELLGLLESRRFLISSNGAKHKHPNKETLEKIVAHSREQGTTLCFNYESEFTLPWQDVEMQKNLNFKAVFPCGAEGLVVEL